MQLSLADPLLGPLDDLGSLGARASSGLKTYEKFAEMIDRHWDGIAAYCQPENKVSLGFVEGLR
jgi:hypothetical protein